MDECPRTVGLLYPGYAAEDDYPVLERLLVGQARLPVVHTSVGEDAHRVDALLDIGAADRLRAGAERLRGTRVHALVWACTSGSFVFGWDGAAAQVAALGDVLGVPASSTSIGFVNAARALGSSRVAVAATYPEDVAVHFLDFLHAGGLHVERLSSQGVVTANEVGALGREHVLDLAVAGDHPRAEAVLLPDTALHTVRWLDELESRVGKPVLTANQVSVWEGLRISGALPHCPGAGRLFRLGAVVTG